MSREADLMFPCESCGAEPGEWCTTFRGRVRPNGQRAAWLHASRWRQVRAVVVASGYEDWLRETDDRLRAIRAGLRAFEGEVPQALGVNPVWVRGKIRDLLAK